MYDPPPFGSFVRIGRPVAAEPVAVTEAPSSNGQLFDDEEADPFSSIVSDAGPSTETPRLGPAVYALVVGSTTASIEPNRRPSALGYEDEDEIRRRQPQIFELLMTHFTGLMIGYSTGEPGGLRRHLPPTPPRLHAHVWPCSDVEVRALTEDLSFLRSVLTPAGGILAGAPGDELAAACLREARRARTDDYQFNVRAGRALAGILADDYERLQAILRNVL